MFKKICISFLIVLMVIAVFDIDLTEVTDHVIDKLIKSEQTEPSIQREYGDTELIVGEKSIKTGDTLDEVLLSFGDAMDSFSSEYGFTWYVFYDDYEHYIQIGIKNNEVCALYSNAADMKFNGIGTGASRYDVYAALSEPVEYILKDNVKYLQDGDVDGKHELDVFFYKDMYVTVFYDIFENNTVTSINIINKDTETAFRSLYGIATPELKQSFEKQNFHLVNAIRVRHGLKPVNYDVKMSKVAELHSKDMADNNYFDHADLNGGNVSDRAKKAGISYSLVAENIATGAQNTIVLNELLMNSEGHRRNILQDFKFLGVGVWFNSESRPYLTQNFYNPPKILIG